MKSAGRIWLYQLLVNRVPGIRKRYHEMRKTYGGKKGQLLSWCALLFGISGIMCWAAEMTADFLERLMRKRN